MSELHTAQGNRQPCNPGSLLEHTQSLRAQRPPRCMPANPRTSPSLTASKHFPPPGKELMDPTLGKVTGLRSAEQRPRGLLTGHAPATAVLPRVSPSRA